MTKGIVHMQIIGGSKEQIALMGKALNKIKEITNHEFEFLITNENVQIRDVKFLIDDLYKMYKKDLEMKEKLLPKIKPLTEEDIQSLKKANPLVDKDIQTEERSH